MDDGTFNYTNLCTVMEVYSNTSYYTHLHTVEKTTLISNYENDEISQTLSKLNVKILPAISMEYFPLPSLTN